MALQGSSGLSCTLLWPSSLIHDASPKPKLIGFGIVSSVLRGAGSATGVWSVVIAFVVCLSAPPSTCLLFFSWCASGYAHEVTHSVPGGVFRHTGPYGFRRALCIAGCCICCSAHPAALSAAGSSLLSFTTTCGSCLVVLSLHISLHLSNLVNFVTMFIFW